MGLASQQIGTKMELCPSATDRLHNPERKTGNFQHIPLEIPVVFMTDCFADDISGFKLGLSVLRVDDHG